MNKRIAVIAYTTFSTDTRVQKEAYAAAEAGYKLDIYTLNDKHVTNYGIFNFIPSNISQYKGQSKISYVFSYIKFFLFCLYSLTKNFPSRKYKFVHIHNMPNFLVFSAIIPKLFNSKIILDIHDLMPEIFSVKFKLPVSHWLIKLLYFEERISAKFANEIIATNKFHVERFKKNGIGNKNITEIINVADSHIFYAPENKNYDDEVLKIAYPSTLAKRLGIDNLIDAIEILHHRNIKVQLNIYGDGEYRNEILNTIKSKDLEAVIKLSDTFVTLEKLSMELDNAHVGIIPLPSDVSNDIAMPVKIYEFFAKKVCVLATELELLKNCFDSTVIFFEDRNAKDLAEKLELLSKNRNLIAEYAEKGYNKFAAKTWDYYKNIYKNLISLNS